MAFDREQQLKSCAAPFTRVLFPQMKFRSSLIQPFSTTRHRLDFFEFCTRAQTHMSTLEDCDSALPIPPRFSSRHEDPEDSLPTTCSICYQDLSWSTALPEAEDPIQLACGHIFGTSCTQTWAEFSTTCPMCRAELSFHDSCTARRDSIEHLSRQDSESSCISEYQAEAGESSAPTMATYQFEEDVWLALEYEEASALCPSHKRRLSAYEEDADGCARFEKRARHADLFLKDDYHEWSLNLEDVRFDELINSHAEWLDRTPNIEDVGDEFVVGYYDVLAC